MVPGTRRQRRKRTAEASVYTLINNRTETRKYRKRRERERERERESERGERRRPCNVGEKWVAAEKRRMINERGCDVRDGEEGGWQKNNAILA